MGKKYSEINIIKIPQSHDVTFVSDPVKELALGSNQEENKGIPLMMIVSKNW